MTTYNVTMSPFTSGSPVTGTLDLTVSGTSATGTLALSGQTVQLTGTVASCGANAQIISMTPTAKFPQFVVILPAAAALQVGLVGFYVSTISGLGGSGTLTGVKTG